MPELSLTTESAEQTQALAESIGRVLRGGEVIELISDLGGGKTTFTKGLAKGLDIKETVQSPTFTISRVYSARDGLELHHFDFYRLHEAGIMADDLVETLAEPKTIAIVEWGEIVRGVLPIDHITIHIYSVGETTRKLQFSAPEKYKYIIEAL